MNLKLSSFLSVECLPVTISTQDAGYVSDMNLMTVEFPFNSPSDMRIGHPSGRRFPCSTP